MTVIALMYQREYDLKKRMVVEKRMLLQDPPTFYCVLSVLPRRGVGPAWNREMWGVH